MRDGKHRDPDIRFEDVLGGFFDVKGKKIGRFGTGQDYEGVILLTKIDFDYQDLVKLPYCVDSKNVNV